MQIQISKKIIFYLSILLLLGTINNKKLFKLNFKKSYNFNITSLSEFDDSEIINNLSYLKQQNLFLLKKDEILENIQKYDIVKDFYIFKNYPLDLIIKIEKTKFLAVTKKNGTDFYIGSNSVKKRILVGLKKIQLINFFPENNIFTFDMAKKPKPEPAIYLNAINSHRLNKEETIIIEDSAVGVKAGVAAGIKVIGLTAGGHWYPSRSTKELKEAGAYKIFNNYKKILKEINSYE